MGKELSGTIYDLTKTVNVSDFLNTTPNTIIELLSLISTIDAYYEIKRDMYYPIIKEHLEKMTENEIYKNNIQKEVHEKDVLYDIISIVKQLDTSKILEKRSEIQNMLELEFAKARIIEIPENEREAFKLILQINSVSEIVSKVYNNEDDIRELDNKVSAIAHKVLLWVVYVILAVIVFKVLASFLTWGMFIAFTNITKTENVKLATQISSIWGQLLSIIIVSIMLIFSIVKKSLGTGK